MSVFPNAPYVPCRCVLCLCLTMESLSQMDWLNGVLNELSIMAGLVKPVYGTGLYDWMTDLVTVCTDGVAVSIGMWNGILPKLQQLFVLGNSLVHVHTLSRKASNQLNTRFLTVRQLITLLWSYCSFTVFIKRWSKKYCYTEKGVICLKLSKFHNVRCSAWRHETLENIYSIYVLSAIQMQLTTSVFWPACLIVATFWRPHPIGFRKKSWLLENAKISSWWPLDSFWLWTCVMVRATTGQDKF